MASLNNLPPIPYKTKFLDNKGFLSGPWAKFFRGLFFRLGGTSSVPSGGADVITNAENIASLTSNSSDLTLRVDALEQGPVA